MSKNTVTKIDILGAIAIAIGSILTGVSISIFLQGIAETSGSIADPEHEQIEEFDALLINMKRPTIPIVGEE